MYYYVLLCCCQLLHLRKQSIMMSKMTVLVDLCCTTFEITILAKSLYAENSSTPTMSISPILSTPTPTVIISLTNSTPTMNILPSRSTSKMMGNSVKGTNKNPVSFAFVNTVCMNNLLFAGVLALLVQLY